MTTSTPTNPYADLPGRAFWRSGVADLSPLELADIYQPRFPISQETPIAAAGSCFAQHIGRQFKQRGYNFLDLEPPPAILAKDRHAEFGFDLYSARYGNVYSARQLLQLFQRANGSFKPKEPIWETDGRFYDPFRPNIQQGGYGSEASVLKDREFHLQKTLELLAKAELFVFTFGLTESWVCRADGAVLPTCPGTVAGHYDAAKYTFHNFSFQEVLADTEAFIALARQHNPQMRFLFTVSPVPLTATASGAHVLAASVYSKSVLRAVCGTLAETHDFVDYFPSYELVASHPMRAMFFEPNLRAVSAAGVAHVMDVFFTAHGAGARAADPSGVKVDKATEDDLVCEEELLEAFSS